MTDLPLSLLPDDDPPLSPTDQLAVAVAGAIGGAIEVQGVPAVSYGRTWVVDPNGGFKLRASGEPYMTSDIGSLQSWSIMAIYSERYAHKIFSDNFGTEKGSAAIGQFPNTAIENELRAAITRALLQHDRVTAVDNLNPMYNPDIQVIDLGTFQLITDDEDRIVFSNVQVQVV